MAGSFESPETERTAITDAARRNFLRIAGPGEVEWGSQVHPKPDDACLVKLDDWRLNPNGAVSGAGSDSSTKSLTESLSTIGIAGTVLLNYPNVYGFSINGFSPGDTQAEKVSISEGDICDWDCFRIEVCIRNRDRRVCQGRTTDRREESCINDKPISRTDSIVIRDSVKRLELTGLSSLAVLEVEESKIVIFCRDCGRYAAVQPSTQKHHRF
jgi:hypothetical protein